MMSGNSVCFPSFSTKYVLDTWPVMEWLKSRLTHMRQLPIVLVPASDEEVSTAARLEVRPGIAYADGFAAGLAIRLDCPPITGDDDFRILEADGPLRLEWLGA